jgi:hypothetical protein
MDGDGLLDLLSMEKRTAYRDGVAVEPTRADIMWQKNTGDGEFSHITNRVGDVNADVSWLLRNYMSTADINNDGLVDVVVAPSATGVDRRQSSEQKSNTGGDSLAWFENYGNGTFGKHNTTFESGVTARGLAIADFDKDGDMDVITAYGKEGYTVHVIEFGAPDVDEVQLIRTTLPMDNPEIQTVTVESELVYSKQVIGMIIGGVDTATYSCSAGSPCDGLRNQIGTAGSAAVKISFNPENCGTQSDNEHSNWCTKKLLADGLIAAQSDTICSTECAVGAGTTISNTLDLSVGDSNTIKGSIQTAICDMKLDDTNAYIFRAGGASGGACAVVVTDISTSIDDATYFLAFEVEMIADYAIGQVPSMVIEYPALDLTSLAAYTTGGYLSTTIKPMFCYDSTGTIGAVPTDCTSVTSGATYAHQVGTPYTNASADQEIQATKSYSTYIHLEGEQPEGDFTLTFTCESDVEELPTNSGASPIAMSFSVDGTGVDTVTVYDTGAFNGGLGFEMYGTIYLTDGITSSYHMVTSGFTCMSGAACSATFSPDFSGNISLTITGEYGVFYSDPDNEHGVSEACVAARTSTTSTISGFETNTDVRSKLIAMSSYIEDVVVTRTEAIDLSTGGSGYLQYIWSITFTTNNGDVPALTITNSLTSTSPGASHTPTVAVASIASTGSFIKGSATFGVNYPHVYETTDGVVTQEDSGAMRYNIPASGLAADLSVVSDTNGAGGGANSAFGSLNVVRTSYTPTGHLRWSGGYTWTVTFTSRNGTIDPIVATSSLTDAAGQTVSLETGYAANYAQNFSRSSNLLSSDDPGTAVAGNQVSGFVSINQRGGTGSEIYYTPWDLSDTSESSVHNVFEYHGVLGVEVSRGSINAAMGYSWTLTFPESYGGIDPHGFDASGMECSATNQEPYMAVEVVTQPALHPLYFLENEYHYDAESKTTLGSFTNHLLKNFTNVRDVVAVDLAQRGYSDIIVADDSGLYYLKLNEISLHADGNVSFTMNMISDVTEPDHNFRSVYTYDINRDGITDVLASTWYSIFWYEFDGDVYFMKHIVEEAATPWSVFSVVSAAFATQSSSVEIFSIAKSVDGTSRSTSRYLLNDDGSGNYTRHDVGTLNVSSTGQDRGGWSSPYSTLHLDHDNGNDFLVAGDFGIGKMDYIRSSAPTVSPTAGTGTPVTSDCEAGHYLDMTTSMCAKCAWGTYQDETGATDCKLCPAGTYSLGTAATGADSCRPCFAATFAPAGSSMCIPCIPGSYAPAMSESCTLCQPGTYATLAKPCTACPAGTFSLEGASTCSPCGSNAFSAGGSSACQVCSLNP